jgi:CubicO group peptidase (beta-lactamase class C family)
MRGVLAWLVACLLAVPALAPAATVPGATWAEVPPAQSGWSPQKLAAAEAYAGHHDVTSLFIVQHGVVVASWGDVAAPTQLNSVRKSLLDALIGIEVARHRIDLDATLGQQGIDDTPPRLTAEEKTATVRMLLEARSGVYHPALYETPGMAKHRPPRGSHAPGTFWYYNNWDFNALGTIYEKATETSIYQAFEANIAGPIGMQDYDPAAQHEVTGAASIHPAYVFHMSARDLARVALLYLDGGRWGDRQVVPADWVRASTTSYSEASHGFGYGYLWWTAATPPDRDILNLPPGAFFMWGAGGQFAFAIPRDDLVIVERTDTGLHLPEPPLRDVAALLRLILAARPGD